VSPERRRRFHPFALRFWLALALVALVSAAILGANLVLLGAAQPRNDPVGQLTPARLLQIQRSPIEPGGDIALRPKPSAHEKHVPGEGSDD
jgi:hypothetical protein